MRRVVVVGVVTFTFFLSAFRVDAMWYIMTPSSGQMYQQNSEIVGAGCAMSPTGIGTFSFLQRNVNAAGMIVPVIEGATFVTSVSIMPGMTSMQVWSGSIAAPGAGWTQSPAIPNMPGMRVPDHDTGIGELMLPIIPYITGSISGPHTVN